MPVVISMQEPENQSPGKKWNVGIEKELGVCAERQIQRELQYLPPRGYTSPPRGCGETDLH